MAVVESNNKYLKDRARVTLDARSLDIDEFGYDTILNKFSGGKYNEGSIDMVTEGILTDPEIKKVIEGRDTPLGGLSPLAKSKFLVQQVKKGKSAEEVMKAINNAEAKKEMEKKGEPDDEKGTPTDRDVNKENEINKDKNWKDGVEDAELFDIEPHKYTMPSPRDILDAVDIAKSKLGFVVRKKKLVEGPGEVIKTVQAKSMRDLNKASKSLYALPNKMEMARRIVENDYLTKKTYTYETESASVILVEDVSGSMRGDRARICCATIIAMLEQDALGLISVKDVILMGDYVTPLNLKGNKIKDYLEKRNKQHAAGTENQKAIVLAAKTISVEKDAEIIILTDGSFDVSEELKKEVIDYKVKTHALLAYGKAAGIKDLCIRTGGLYEDMTVPLSPSIKI
jgi:hypothetical protein